MGHVSNVTFGFPNSFHVSAAFPVKPFGSFVLAVALSASAASAEWLFRFSGDKLQPLDTLQTDAADWVNIRVPGINNYLMTCTNSFGWYRWKGELPPFADGRTVRLWLGRVVDLDWTYWNHQPIGSHTTPETGWRYRRVYDVPGNLVQDGEAELLVGIQRLISAAGMMDRPQIGVSCLPEKIEAEDAKIDPAMQAPEASQALVSVPDQIQYVKTRVRLPSVPPSALDKGFLVFRWKCFFDVFEISLNGKRVALGGAVQPALISALKEDIEFTVPIEEAAKASATANEIIIRGGMAGVVNRSQLDQACSESLYLLLDLEGMRTDPRWYGGRLPEQEAHIIRALLQINKGPEAVERLEQIRLEMGEADLPIIEEVAALVHARSGSKEEMVNAVENFLKKNWGSTLTRELMESLVEAQKGSGSFSPGCIYLGEDRSTRGNWPLAYGKSAYLLCGMNYNVDFGGGPRWPLTYVFSTADAHFPVMGYVSQQKDQLDGALVNPRTRSMAYAWRDDYGESKPFENKGPDLVLSVDLPDGDWVSSLYVVDPDWAATEHPRDLSIAVFSENKDLLAAARASHLEDGVYFRFAIRGGQKVIYRIFKHLSPDANLSGFFLDPLPRRIPSPAGQSDNEGTRWLDWQEYVTWFSSETRPDEGGRKSEIYRISDEPDAVCDAWNWLRLAGNHGDYDAGRIVTVFFAGDSEERQLKFNPWFSQVQGDLTVKERLELLRQAASTLHHLDAEMLSKRLADQALDHFQDDVALQFYQGLDQGKFCGEALWRQALVYLSRGDRDSAKTALEKLWEKQDAGQEPENFAEVAKSLLESLRLNR
ncbi:MAG: hypothetical protein HYU36_22290 [Planctomycetes bacterium]|nr:hypothetical protein [Planctomycetota bacterium]